MSGGKRDEREPPERKKDRVLDAYEAMQQRRKGRLTDWQAGMTEDDDDGETVKWPEQGLR